MPLKDPEALRAYRQAYYARTRAEISAKKRAYYQAHRAKILQQLLNPVQPLLLTLAPSSKRKKRG